jgi:hypothetical protein
MPDVAGMVGAKGGVEKWTAKFASPEFAAGSRRQLSSNPNHDDDQRWLICHTSRVLCSRDGCACCKIEVIVTNDTDRDRLFQDVSLEALPRDVRRR